MIQNWALMPFLAISGAVIAVFAWVMLSTRNPKDFSYAIVARLRVVFFLGLSSLLACVFALTIGKTPYPYAVKGLPDRVVLLSARQFSFIFSNPPQAETDESPLKYKLNSDVEFDITSADVNHGVAFYNPVGVLVGQTQAMPGYVNKLRIRLDQPGIWNVLCLEYCGPAHHVMRSAIEVIP